jgi:hypothetical protein
LYPEQIPAVLNFLPGGTEEDIFGWRLGFGENTTYSLFIDPLDSAKTIYSRKDKTPDQRKLQLKCRLYANPGINTGGIEEEIIERCLKPFVLPIREGIEVMISFDGKTFEIREYPLVHVNPVIFRGEVPGRFCLN